MWKFGMHFCGINLFTRNICIRYCPKRFLIIAQNLGSNDLNWGQGSRSAPDKHGLFLQRKLFFVQIFPQIQRFVPHLVRSGYDLDASPPKWYFVPVQTDNGNS